MVIFVYYSKSNKNLLQNFIIRFFEKTRESVEFPLAKLYDNDKAGISCFNLFELLKEENRMKKIIALLMACMLILGLAACGSPDTTGTGAPAGNEAAPTEAGATNPATAAPEGAASDVKIGLICVHDENSGYDAAHIDGLKAACAELGIDFNSQVILKTNIPEDEVCGDMAIELAEAGCGIVFSDSYGHQTYMQQAASEYPDVTYVACTGDMAAVSGLSNLKNMFPYTYESRYVSGVVAGMKLKEMLDAGTITDPYVGYVGAHPYAEVVCGYTAFLLGIQSIVPEAHMDVQYQQLVRSRG